MMWVAAASMNVRSREVDPVFADTGDCWYLGRR
jgi:hypothetical protein